jgi:hypothetical protein
MRACTVLPVLALAGLLFVCGSVRAREPSDAVRVGLPPLPRPQFDSARLDFTEPSFGGPTGSPGRSSAAGAGRGAPVETLERVTSGALPGEEPEGEAEPDEIETDRDSFTPATTLAARRRLIVESAYSFIDNRGVKETHSLPELVLRYGLTDRIELRLGWNYEVGGAGSDVTGVDAGDDDPFSSRARLRREYTLLYGVKLLVTKQERWLPGSALILQGFTPTGGSPGASTDTQVSATYVAGWQLPRRCKFDAAIRYATASEEGDHFHSWAPSAVLKVPLGEKWNSHVEYFGIFTAGKERNATKHFISPGLHYLVTRDLEIGFRLGWGLNDQSARFFSNVGVGWRF